MIHPSLSGGTEAGEPARAAALLLVEALARRGRRIVFAESCTGGLLSGLVTSVPGASRVFWGGIVSYTEDSKRRLLGVRESTLAGQGVVSTETAAEMAKGALAVAGTEYSVAVTGWAGPDAPAGENGPGRVCLAWAEARPPRVFVRSERYAGPREAVRMAAALACLHGALALVDGGEPGTDVPDLAPARY